MQCSAFCKRLPHVTVIWAQSCPSAELIQAGHIASTLRRSRQQVGILHFLDFRCRLCPVWTLRRFQRTYQASKAGSNQMASVVDHYLRRGATSLESEAFSSFSAYQIFLV